MRVAILDDYQNVALQLAAVQRHAEVTVFRDHIAEPSAVVERLRPFDVLCVMRERTPLTSEILHELPRLRLVASTGPVNASIDSKAAAARGITITSTGYDSTPTIELAWSLIMASLRGLDREAASLRAGGWQVGLGSNLRDKNLGIVGLGRVGTKIARIGLSFGMKVINYTYWLVCCRNPEVSPTESLRPTSQIFPFSGDCGWRFDPNYQVRAAVLSRRSLRLLV
jgi:phosphoglycerate dehydrogenase-like enzyme